MHEFFNKLSSGDLNISVKIDGSPALIFGTNPVNGKFFISTKSIFNKTPKLAYSTDEIPGMFNPAIVSMLTIAFEELSKYKSVLKDIYQADLLFTNETKSGLTNIEDESYITFQPNLIVYAVPKSNKDLFNWVNKSKLGLVIHFAYDGKIENLRVSSKNIEPIVKKLQGTIFATTPTITNISNTLFAKSDEDVIRSMLDPLNISSRNGLFTVDAITLKAYVNTLVRGNKLSFNYRECQKHFEEKGQVFKVTSKDFEEFFRVYSELITVKNTIIHKLTSLEYNLKNTFLKTDTGYKTTSPEGFVMMSGKDYMVKFVDRLEFSRLNFLKVK